MEDASLVISGNIFVLNIISVQKLLTAIKTLFKVEVLLRTFTLMIIWHIAWYFQEGNAVTAQLGSAAAIYVNNSNKENN